MNSFSIFMNRIPNFCCYHYSLYVFENDDTQYGHNKYNFRTKPSITFYRLTRKWVLINLWIPSGNCFTSHEFCMWSVYRHYQLTHWGRDKLAAICKIFSCIFFRENVRIALNIWRRLVPKVRINNIPALIQIKAWRWPCDKPLSE